MQDKTEEQYWNIRWETAQTGWDIQEASPPIRAYIDQLTNKNISILIPGCGNAYEAAYLLEKGFTNVTLLDISPHLVETLKARFKDERAPGLHILLGDFFEHTGSYDLVLEQTFFCAINPSLRPAYVEKMAALIRPGGRLVGVLFNRAFEGGPPFGGFIEEYRPLFEEHFLVKTLEPCYNSIQPRAGAEAFVVLIRP